MDAVNAVTVDNSATVAAMRAAHAQALAQHYANTASSSSMSSNSVIIDPRPEYDADTEAALLHQRLRQREASAIRRVAEQRTAAVDSQRHAKQEQIRAKAAAATDPYNNPNILHSRKNVPRVFREPEYQGEITQYMIQMDVSPYPAHLTCQSSLADLNF